MHEPATQYEKFGTRFSLPFAVSTLLVGGRSGLDAFSDEAVAKIRRYEALGCDHLPICMAKTHLSFSDNPDLKNAPEGFRITVRDMRLSLGAGFIFPLVGSMRTMPGLSGRPAFIDVDLDSTTGRIDGLF